MTLPKMEMSRAVLTLVLVRIAASIHISQSTNACDDATATRIVSHLFSCPDVLRPPAPPSTNPTPRPDHFIAYVLYRTQLHSSVSFAALYLLQRLKACFPAAKGSSGHRLFISARFKDYLRQHLL